MYDHEYYAHAFVASSESDEKVNNYLEFKEAVKVFRDSPQFVDALLFSRERFDAFREDFEALYSAVVFNFLDIVIEDGLIEQIFKIETSIRDLLVKEGHYNYCVVESADELSKDFEGNLN